MANVYDDILDSTVVTIRALSLVSDENVLKCKVSRKFKNDALVRTLPCVLVAPFGSVSRTAYSNLKDEVIYPVLVAYIAASNNSQTHNMTKHLTALQELGRAFRPRGSISISEALVDHINTEVAPRSSYDLPAWFEQYDLGDTLLRIRVNEPRTQAV